MTQSLFTSSITFVQAVYTKVIALGLATTLITTAFAGITVMIPLQTEAACASTPSYITVGPKNGTKYFANGDTFSSGTYRISYESGFFSWDSGSHFMFYTPAYGGRGFRAVYTNGSSQTVPILRMANGSFATTYYTSEADVAGAYDDVYYQFNSTGGKIGISFNDDDSDNRGAGVTFKLSRVSGGTCTDDTDTHDDDDDYGPLTGSCYANRSSVTVGEDVTFRAEANGGDGSYTYSWDGSEDLDGNSRTVTHEYDRPGTKTATVTIRSDGRSIVRNCSVYVYDDYYYDYSYDYNYYYNNNRRLTASCSATSGYVGDSITWTVNASGGDGRYTYSWSGTNNLSGTSRTVREDYATAGVKNASVRVRSDGDSITVNCSTIIFDRNNYVYGGTYTVPTYTTPTYTYTYTAPTTVHTTNSNSGAILTLDQTGPTQVSLNSVPYTGLSDTAKTILFMMGLVVWSVIMAYIFIIRPRLQS